MPISNDNMTQFCTSFLVAHAEVASSLWLLSCCGPKNSTPDEGSEVATSLVMCEDPSADKLGGSGAASTRTAGKSEPTQGEKHAPRNAGMGKT